MHGFSNLRKNIGTLIELNEEAWAKIESSFKIKHFKKGDTLVREGQVCKYVAYNINGIFREYFYHDGIDKTSDFIFHDSFFSAYTSFVNQTPSEVYIEALIDSQVLLMDFQSKQNLYKTVPEWDRLARKITEQHYAAKEKRANMLSSMTAIEKYEALLKKGNPEIIKNIPLHYIASYLGITPETLSRVRKIL